MNKLREVVLELVKVMPKSVVETAKRASKSNMRFVGPLLRRGAEWLVGTGGIILRGPGAGLEFDLGSTGFPGQILGTTDIHEQKAIADCLSAGDVFYDIGANAGFYSIIGGSIVGRNGKVYAFEPHKKYAKLTKRNVYKNRMVNIVDVFEVAISSIDGKVKINTEKENPQSLETNMKKVSKGRKVEARKIDSIVNEEVLRPPDLVKIDVEGHEIEVLKGMTDVCKKHKPVIALEVHGNMKEVEIMMKKELEELGYESEKLLEEEGKFRSHLMLK
jgi:FkbM family methyltransferase